MNRAGDSAPPGPSRWPPWLVRLMAFVLGTGLANGLGLLWSALAVRSLGAAVAADYLAAAFLLQAVHMATFPLGNTATQLVATWQAQGQPGKVWSLLAWLRGQLAVVLLVATALGAAGYVLLVDRLHFAEPIALALGLLAAGWTLATNLSRGLLRGLAADKPLLTSYQAEAGLRLLAGAALLWVLPRASVAVAAHGLGLLASIAVAWWGLRRALPTRPDVLPALLPGEVRAVLLPMVALSVADAVWQNLDVLAAKHLLAGADAGAYGAAAVLSRLFSVLAQPFALLIVPELVAAAHGQTGSSSGRRLAGLLGTFAVLAAGLLLVLALWSGPLTQLVYGRDFAAAAPLLWPQALGALAGQVAMLLGQALVATHRRGYLPLHAGGLLLLAWVLGLPAAGLDLAWRQAAVKGLFAIALAVLWWLQRHTTSRPAPSAPPSGAP
jgi:O-antigen/teichoic acid export membrane protein